MNIINEAGESISGLIEITGPSGDNILAESFELVAEVKDESEDNHATFNNVWKDSGEYEVTVTLDDGSEIRGQSTLTESITIDDPDNKMLAVILGGDEFENGINILVGENATDFE